MQGLLVLLVISIPILGIAGLIVCVFVSVRAGRIRKRVEELESRQPIGPNHPVSLRIQDLQERVAALEGQTPKAHKTDRVSPTADAHVVVSPVPLESPLKAQPKPPAPIEDRPSEVPCPAPPLVSDETAATDSPPPSSRPLPRSGIEWERWIGVRGAAAAGGIVLALAALLFFQYSIEHGLISPTMRVVLGVIVGIFCLVGSQWLVKRDQSAAANALAGAGVVILYGATWAAQNRYDLIGAVPAFVLMVVITVVCVALAVGRDARFIAVLGLLGGFATPILVASEVDSPEALFGYILLLDLGLLWLARSRNWPLLSVLSLAGTALHQAIWIFGSMGDERAVLGLGVLAVFSLAFLFSGSPDREPSLLWRATRAGGVAIPFAFALHFAGTAQLAENPWPLGVLLLILSAGACWLARREKQDVALAAAGGCLGIMALWFLNHQVAPALAWQAVALCVALAALFTVAAEISRWHPSSGRLGVAALGSSLGFLALLVLATTQSQVVKPWPWIAGWAILGGLLVLHSRWQRRGWARLAAGLGPALGFFLAIENHGRNPASLESWVWLALIVAAALAFQILAALTKDEEGRVWAEHAAAATAIALMVPAAVVSSTDRSASEASIAAILVLGLMAALSATRSRVGIWFLAASGATAFWQTVVYFGVYRHSAADPESITVFGLLMLSAVLFMVWPAVVAPAFRHHWAAWWGGALAGPFWFVVLKSAFVSSFGDGAIGLLPVVLGLVALATVLWVRPRLAGHAETQRTALVWYLAVALGMVSVAIPLQLEKEWITIGLALNGLAIVALWVRLEDPGLKYYGLALLGVATARLVANPAVLDYHIREGAPVLNWIAYTYLVPALALVISRRFLKSREVDRLVDWEQRFYPSKRAIGAASCGLAAVVVVFAWINLTIADIFATGPNLELNLQRLPARDVTTSVAWAVYALVLLAIGVRSRSGSLRWLSLGLLMLTLGKVFLQDLGELEDLYRVGSLVGLAASLIIVSLIYQRFVFRQNPNSD